MKITVDKKLCTGCSLCASMCPDVFEIKNGKASVKKPAGSEKCNMEKIAAMCGADAITVKK